MIFLGDKGRVPVCLLSCLSLFVFYPDTVQSFGVSVLVGARSVDMVKQRNDLLVTDLH